MVAGQHQRVRYVNEALRERFTVKFFLPERLLADPEVRSQLEDEVDEVVPIPETRRWPRAIDHVGARLWAGMTGLKHSAWWLGRRLISPEALLGVMSADVDVAFFHYCHASEAAAALEATGVPCVLDMHDVLWRARTAQLPARHPRWRAARSIENTRRWEEASWRRFSAIIAINAAEAREVQALLPDKAVFYTPMGLRLDEWPYCWTGDDHQIIGYYGGLSTARAEREVERLVGGILPRVREASPKVQLKVVGSNPTPRISELLQGPDTELVGYVERPADELSRFALVVCPFIGTYGFRSRIIELMATGVPVVATPDAVVGMGFTAGLHIRVADDDAGLAAAVVELLAHDEQAAAQSQAARQLVETEYDFASSYRNLASDLYQWLADRTSFSTQ
jgi:glycosyltransferase involved in cell wall biosynthesis